jgi:hypothetical protein
MKVGVDAVYPAGVKATRAALDPVYLIPFVE